MFFYRKPVELEEEEEEEMVETKTSKHVAPDAISQPSETQSAAELQANCPVCRAGVVKRKITRCGLLFGIFLFPIGLICCFLLSAKQCDKCGYNEGL
jgi:hypothetical protein